MCAADAELGKEWILQSPQHLQGRHLAMVENVYKLSGAVSDVRKTHAALSASVTSLAIRIEEYGARQAPVPLTVRPTFLSVLLQLCMLACLHACMLQVLSQLRFSVQLCP